jgi:hypothetical protein
MRAQHWQEYRANYAQPHSFGRIESVTEDYAGLQWRVGQDRSAAEVLPGCPANEAAIGGVTPPASIARFRRSQSSVALRNTSHAHPEDEPNIHGTHRRRERFHRCTESYPPFKS